MLATPSPYDIQRVHYNPYAGLWLTLAHGSQNFSTQMVKNMPQLSSMAGATIGIFWPGYFQWFKGVLAIGLWAIIDPFIPEISWGHMILDIFLPEPYYIVGLSGLFLLNTGSGIVNALRTHTWSWARVADMFFKIFGIVFTVVGVTAVANMFPGGLLHFVEALYMCFLGIRELVSTMENTGYAPAWEAMKGSIKDKLPAGAKWLIPNGATETAPPEPPG